MCVCVSQVKKSGEKHFCPLPLCGFFQTNHFFAFTSASCCSSVHLYGVLNEKLCLIALKSQVFSTNLDRSVDTRVHLFHVI